MFFFSFFYSLILRLLILSRVFLYYISFFSPFFLSYLLRYFIIISLFHSLYSHHSYSSWLISILILLCACALILLVSGIFVLSKCRFTKLRQKKHIYGRFLKEKHHFLTKINSQERNFTHIAFRQTRLNIAI